MGDSVVLNAQYVQRVNAVCVQEMKVAGRAGLRSANPEETSEAVESSQT